MTRQIEISIIIQVPPSEVWRYLTLPHLMKQWMGEPEMDIEVVTDWKIGSSILIKGFHHIKFENKGKVLKFEPYQLLSYDYLSSISRLPDKPGNHTVLEFLLEPGRTGTLLTLKLSNFPTEAVFKHVEFYWRATLEILRNLIEQNAGNFKSSP